MIFAPNNIQGFLYTPGRYFLIPEFQRPYSWEAENIRSFLDDLESLLDSDQKHYFGSVVYVNDSDDLNASVIIDGQQRVTTALLMLMAIYHIIEIDADKSQIVAAEVEEKYLFNSSKFSEEKNRIKLKAVTADDQIFKKIYNKEALDVKEKQSRIYQAYMLFNDYFRSKNHLEKYITALARFEIVTIALDSKDDNPQRVFESINSTGKPLTDGDKIRNFALMLNSNDDRNYVISKYWKNIEAPLTDANKDYITDFFRSYIINKRQAIIPMGSVYPEFKKIFARQISPEQSREELDVFYQDIVSTLEFYRLAKFGDDVSERFGSIKGILFKMRYIQIELYIPFALSVLGYYDQGKLSSEELLGIFKTIETYFARRIVCNIPTTSVDKMLASLHKDILELQSTSPETGYLDVMSYILLTRSSATRFPQDNEIVTAVQTNQTYNQRKAHVNFILTSVDDQSKESSLLKQIADNETKLTIEHILPQTLTRTWRDELGPDAEEIQAKYVHTLANLTLTGYNSEYSNRDFSDKKAMTNGFNSSPLAINREVKSTDKWDETALKRRQKWWINNLERVWPLPTTSYIPVAIDTKVSLFDEVDLTGTKIRVLHMLGDSIPVTTWAEALDLIVERMFELDEDLYDKIVRDEFIARYIRTDETALINPMQVNDSEYYVESGTNTNYKRLLITKLATIMNWSKEDLIVELMEPINGEGKAAEYLDEGDMDIVGKRFSTRPPQIRQLYEELRQEILSLDPELVELPVQAYIAFKINKKFVFNVYPHNQYLTLCFEFKKGEITIQHDLIEYSEKDGRASAKIRSLEELPSLKPILVANLEFFQNMVTN